MNFSGIGYISEFQEQKKHNSFCFFVLEKCKVVRHDIKLFSKYYTKNGLKLNF